MSTQQKRTKNSFSNGPSSEYIQHLQEQDKEDRNRRFKHLVIGATLVIATGLGVNWAMSDPAAWAGYSKIVNTSVLKQATALEKVQQFKVELATVYDANKSALVKLDALKDVAKVTGSGSDLGSFLTQNNVMNKKISDTLNQNETVLKGLFSIAALENAKADSSVIKKEKSVFFTEDNIKTLSSYTSATPLSPVIPMVALNKNINAKVESLTKEREKVIASVIEGMKNKPDFNQGALAFLSAGKGEIDAAKSQAQAAKAAGDLNDADIAELTKATDTAYNNITSSISADKAKVEELAKQFGASNVKTTTDSSGNSVVVVNSGSSGMSFFDYWLLSNWISSSSASSSYSNGYAAGSRAATAPTSALASAPASKSYSSLYSVNNPNTPTAQKLASIQAASGKGNFNTLSNTIAAKRNAAISARAEASRAAAARSQSNTARASGFGKSGGFSSGGG